MNHPLDGGGSGGQGWDREQRGEPAAGGDVSAGERFGWGADPPARRGYGRAIYGESGLGDISPDERWGEAPRGGFAGRGPKGYRRSDDRIGEEVCERLTRDDAVDASDLSVRVESGHVTLEGSCATRSQRQRAESVAAEVAGVSDVRNLVRVRAPRA